RPDRAIPHEAEERGARSRSGAVADAPEHAGSSGARGLVDEAAQVAAEDAGAVGRLDRGAARPGSIGRAGIRGALGRGDRGDEAARRVWAAPEGRARVLEPGEAVDDGGSVGGVEPDGIDAVELEAELRLVGDVEAAHREDGGRRDRVLRVRVVVVEQLESGDVD